MDIKTILKLIPYIIILVAAAWIVIQRIRYKNLDMKVDEYIVKNEALRNQIDALVLQQHETQAIKGKQKNGKEKINSVNNSDISKLNNKLVRNRPKRPSRES